MHLLSGIKKRRPRTQNSSALATGRTPSSFQSPAMKKTANKLAAFDTSRFQSSSSASKKDKTPIRISKSTLDAVEIEAEALSYPMTLYNLTDHLMNKSASVMFHHANPSDEDREEEAALLSSNDVISITNSMDRLNIDPKLREKELKNALNLLQSTVGSLTTKVASWDEAKEKLSTVLIFPDGDGNCAPLVQEEVVNEDSWARMPLGRPGSATKRKAAKAGHGFSKKKQKRPESFSDYFKLVFKSDKHNRWSKSKWGQVKHTKVPEPIASKDDDEIEKQEMRVPLTATKVIESVTAKMDKLLRSKVEEVERDARARELEEEKRIQLEIEKREEAERLAEEAQKAASNLLRALTSEEQAIVKKVIYGRGPETEKLATSETDSVQRSSMQTLRPGTWLNDEVIHYFYSMLAKRDEALSAANPGRKRSHFFKSFFFTKLLDEGASNDYKYANVKRWSKNVPGKDIFALDKIFVACNVNRTHWTCAVIFMQKKTIQFFDSMGGEGQGYTHGLMRYLKDEWSAKKGGGQLPDADKWKIVGAERGVPQQYNGYDCGVFTCMFADFLSIDRPLSFNQDHINQCRERIALSIMKGVAIE